MFSSAYVITPPSGDLFLLDEVKLFLRVDGDELDAEVAGHLGKAIADIERITATRLQTQTVKMLAERWEDLDRLPIGPVQSIAGIDYIDGAGATQTVAPSVYTLTGLSLERGIEPQFGQYWPAAYSAITLRLVVGYDDADIPLPPNIRQLVLDTARARFDGTSIDLFAATVNDRLWL